MQNKSIDQWLFGSNYKKLSNRQNDILIRIKEFFEDDDPILYFAHVISPAAFPFFRDMPSCFVITSKRVVLFSLSSLICFKPYIVPLQNIRSYNGKYDPYAHVSVVSISGLPTFRSQPEFYATKSHVIIENILIENGVIFNEENPVHCF